MLLYIQIVTPLSPSLESMAFLDKILGAAEKIFSRGGGGNGRNQGRQGRHYDDLVRPGAAFWPPLSKGGTC